MRAEIHGFRGVTWSANAEVPTAPPTTAVPNEEEESEIRQLLRQSTAYAEADLLVVPHALASIPNFQKLHRELHAQIEHGAGEAPASKIFRSVVRFDDDELPRVLVTEPTRVGRRSFQNEANSGQRNMLEMRSHVEYKVWTTRRGHVEAMARRRYQEFTALVDKLRDEVPGALVPLLPGKALYMRNFQEGFLEHRRLNLQRFLNQILAHHELSISVAVNDFLCTRRRLPAGTKAAVRVTSSNINQVPTTPTTPKLDEPRSGGSRVKIKINRAVAADDAWFEEVAASVAALEAPATRVVQQIKGLDSKTESAQVAICQLLDAWCAPVTDTASSPDDEQNSTNGKAEQPPSPARRRLRCTSKWVGLVPMRTTGDVHTCQMALTLLTQRQLERAELDSSLPSVLDQKLELMAQLKNVLKGRNSARARGLRVEGRRGSGTGIGLGPFAKITTEERFAELSDRVKREHRRFERDSTRQLKSALLTFARDQATYHAGCAFEFERLKNELLREATTAVECALASAESPDSDSESDNEVLGNSGKLGIRVSLLSEANRHLWRANSGGSSGGGSGATFAYVPEAPAATSPAKSTEGGLWGRTKTFMRRRSSLSGGEKAAFGAGTPMPSRPAAKQYTSFDTL